MAYNPDYVYQRGYRGKVKGVVLDWSGTIADAYVLAPAVVFVEVFAKEGVTVTMQDARGPMGLRKDLHIKAMTEDPVVAEKWKAVHKKYPNQKDVDKMFKNFVPMQLACLKKYTTLLPGAAKCSKDLKKRGIMIGSSTGFLRAMVEILAKDARKQGFIIDATVAGDDVVHGARPKPFMVFRNMDLMDVHPVQSIVKVDDTTSGIGEALEAGCWGVGVSLYSNYMDINSLAEAKKMPKKEIDRRNQITKEILQKAGAHYVIDSIAELPKVIDDINKRLARGERP
ncbi:MAG: phosphonoacetaldehyde hydrolase [Rhodospirillaceae bacterium]|nr:phosphonoacetaldehyde hydrolase [Rhodospirillaceae bacterium]